MNISQDRRAKRVCFYVNETDQIAGVSTPIWIVEFLRKRNASGATAIRGAMGFGGTGRIHTMHIVDLAIDLPVIVEWIDDETLVEELLPEIVAKINPGLVTVDDTTIVLYAPQSVRDVSAELTAAAVMTHNLTVVAMDTPVRQVVERMRQSGVRAVPVVEAGKPVGMITSCDLLIRAGLEARLSHFPAMQQSEVNQHLSRLRPVIAGAIMSAPVVTVRAGLTLDEVATMMVHRKLKRLPVVDDFGVLVGVVSRVDLLRTVAQFPHRENPQVPTFPANGNIPLEGVMRRDVPIVFSQTPIAQVLQAMTSTRLNLALVVDEQKRVVGIITAAELLQRVTPALRDSAVSALIHRLPFLHPTADEALSQRHAHASTAAELMTNDCVTANSSALLKEVIADMLGGAHKVIAVVDDEERLIGVVDRADVLRGLLNRAQ